MAWSVPVTYTTDILNAADLNADLRNNMNETAVAKAENTNGYFVTTGPNAVEERRFSRAFEHEDIEITSSSAVDVGPSIEVTHGGAMLVMWNVRIYIESGGVASIGPAVEGKETMLVRESLRTSVDITDIFRGFCFRWFEGLGAGTDTVSLKGLASSGTAHFAQRELIIKPF